MSGNRANAAARNRRAGGGPEMQAPIPGRGGMVPGRGMPVPGRGMAPSPQQMQQMQQRQMQQQQQAQQQQMPPPAPGVPGPTQMTVQNAVTLMSIRLGRLETFMQKMEGEGEGSANENSRIVDDGVFNSIVSRLDALERGHKLLSGAKPLTVNNESNDQLADTVNYLKSEVAELKDLLLGLQSFTMQTNQKLAEIVFSQEQEDQDQEQYQEDPTNLVILPSDEQDFVGQDLTGSLNVNLKELIQQELSNTDISEIVAEQ
jgi:hypothetical protein